MIKRLSGEQIAAVHRRNAAERTSACKRAIEEVARQMAGQRCGTSDDATEQRFAEAVIAAYLDAVPGGEASFAELRALLLECAIEPQRVMPYAKRLLLGPAEQE